jgi:AcrR family transcriptional regulator
MPNDIVDRAADAVLKLTVDRPWRDITLRDIAMEAGAPLADLYDLTPSKAELLDKLLRRFDQAALRSEDASPDAADRLFEAVMARLEAMEPHRLSLMAISRDEGRLNGRMGLRFAITARALLEAAGIDAGGRRGAIRVVAMTAVWARVVQVWGDDEGALNRTMAEIDKLLKQMRKRLGQIGAGF